MRQKLLIALLCGGLGACAVATPPPLVVPKPPGNLAADRRVCNATYPPKLGNYLPHAQCVNAAVERDAIPSAHHPDLVRLQEQLRAKYSAQIDQGLITPPVGEQKMAEADRLVETAMHDRDSGQAANADAQLGRLQAMVQR